MAASSPAKRAPRPAKARMAAPDDLGTKRAVNAIAPRVVLDLDSLSKATAFPDLELPPEPFTFLLDAVTYTLSDPRDSDWKMALQLSQNPFLLMRTSLAGADDPVADPTEEEFQACRERLGLPSPRTAQPAEPAADGDTGGGGDPGEVPVVPAVIDRFTCAHLPTWKLDALFARWHDHYKIELKDGKGILAALLGR